MILPKSDPNLYQIHIQKKAKDNIHFFLIIVAIKKLIIKRSRKFSRPEVYKSSILGYRIPEFSNIPLIKNMPKAILTNNNR